MAIHTFQFRIAGDGVRPETTPISELADFLRHIEKAVLSNAGPQDQIDPETDVVSAVAISAGSTSITFAVTTALVASFSGIEAAVVTSDFSRITRAAHQELYEAQRRLNHLGWTVQYAPSNSLGKPAPLELAIPEPPPARTTVGPTVVYGTCTRIGGVKPRGQLRLTDGNLLSFDLPRDLAIELGHRLYEDIGIRGIAKWDVENWRVEEFEAAEIDDFVDPDPLEGFRRLWQVSKGIWDGVDAARYVDELRSE